MNSRKPTAPDRDERVSRTTPLLSLTGETRSREPSAPDAPAPTEPWPRDSQGLAEGSAPRFTAGAMLAGRYRIVHLLGRGGMGEVYRAEDLELEQTVALKLLPEAVENEPERLARLRGEVRLARSVTHAGVCRVYDLQEAHGRHFLSMEHVEGEDLGTLLRRIGRLSHDKAVDIARQICHGLDAIHGQGILHRDLKPANIMLDAAGRARIMDFGLASMDVELPACEIMQGTPAYMAPEQLTGQAVSVQSDLYALGLVLYKLFTGRAAHHATTKADLGRMHLDGHPPPPPSSLAPDIAPVVDRVILQCLEAEPGARPRSALAVAEALSEVAPAGALKALLACELGGEDLLQSSDADALRRAHARAARALFDAHHGREIDGDGFVAVFDHPGDALACALAIQGAVAALARKEGVALESRAAVHLAESRERERVQPAAPSWTVAPPARALVARLLAVAEAGQVLLTRAAFDLARERGVRAPGPGALRWEAHGSYELEDQPEPVELCEVGLDGVAPLRQPRDSDLARRRRVQERITGWRPAPGQGVPGRPQWIVDSKLGEGGFGEVWLATHDKTGERRVFKFCYDAERLRALQREITLFRLLKETLGERDDIARIHEWNLDQPPYFIESAYTAGGSLADWAAEQGGVDRVPLDVRLEIIAQVATALAAAHSVGVLHKDIKPANVLITTDLDGRVRAQLHDFGVGMVTETGRLAEARFTVMGMTETVSGGALAGTRLYMAPELLEGKPATVQADIYAVGVMLYQVVVGDLSRALAPGWERDIDDELLREDIAAVVDRASERRIDSAQRLAERLRALAERRRARALARREQAEALRARAALARARQRRRILMFALAVVTAFAGVTVVQSRRVAHEAELARRESEAAEQVTAFLLGLFESSDPYRTGGQEVTVRQVLDRGQERIDHELEDQPAVRARLMHTMGLVYGNLGMYDPAVDLLEQALAARRGLRGDNRLAIAGTLAALASTWHDREDNERAEPLAREALAIREQLLDEHHLDLARSREILGDILYEQRDLDAAERLYRQVLEARRHAGDPVGIADSLQRLGAVLLARGKPHEAKVLYRKSLEMYRSALPEDSPKVAHGIRHLGLAHLYGDEPEQAEPLFRQVLAMEQRSFGEEHPMVASATAYLALSLLRQGELDEAETLYQRALAMYRKLVGDESWSVASIIHDLGQVVQAGGELDRAERMYRDALARFGRIADPEDVATGKILNDLGILLQARGAHDEAERAYRRAMAIFREARGPADPLTALATANLADVLLVRGAVVEACPLAEQAVARLRDSFPEGNWRSGHAQSVLGACLAAHGDHAGAERLMLDGNQALQRQPGERWRYGDRALRRIIDFYEARNQGERAEQYRTLLSTGARMQ